MTGNVLVVEDDRDLAAMLRQELGAAGHDVEVAHTGTDALLLADVTTFDLVLLDLNLPDVDGIEVAKRLRGSGVGIVMLTARADVESRATGLYAGASDYVVKPFDLPELLARVHARLRDQRGSRDTIELGPIAIDRAQRTCIAGEQRLDLTAREFELLELLATNVGRIFSRDDLERRLYGPELPASNTIEVFVSNLRKKLSAAGIHDAIETVRGMGYVLRAR